MQPTANDRRPTCAAYVQVGAAVGAMALAATAIGDGVVSWTAAKQFLPSTTGRLTWLLYLAASHALVGALAGAAAGALAWLWLHATRLGDLVRYGKQRHHEAQDRDPRNATAGLSLVVVGIPLLALALTVSYRALGPALATRKNFELVISTTMLVTIAALVAAIAMTFLLARPVELALRRLASGRHARVLSSLSALVAAAAILSLAAAAVGAFRWRATLDLLPLRGPVVVLIAFGVATLLIPLGWRGFRRFSQLTRRRRIAFGAAAVVAAVVAMLSAGANAAVVKASSAYTGLGGTVSRIARRALDFDRDGFSGFLGGGDCDDGDATTFPGAEEIPDDGIDQNCVGGDVSLAGRAHDPKFVPLPPSVPPALNVLLITLDTVRADHIGAYGYRRPTTPAIDELAAGGTLFENGWAHAPSTRYSMPAILSGRLPLDVYYDTSIEGWPGLSARATTIAEIAKAAGLTTGAITNYWYFDEIRRMNQGFDEYDNTSRALHSAVTGQGPAHTRGSSSVEQTNKAIRFVDAHNLERWFLWVHYYDPHFEYERHPELPESNFGDAKIDLYDGELRFTDHHLGRLFSHLRQTGQYERTAVVVVADHGEGFGEHGIDLHGYHLYAAQTKVPFIIRVPGLAPRRASTPVGHIDLVPTVANLLGQPATSEMMGRSLLDLMSGSPDIERAVIQQLSYEGNHEMRALANRSCHVIYNMSPDTSWESYRIDRDPAERNDLGDRDCKAARAELAQWIDAAQIPAGATEALLPSRPTTATASAATFGDSIELLDVAAPARARRGDSVELTWTYAVVGTPPKGYRVFVHAEDGKSGRFTGDHAPVRPLSWWKPGQFIRYTTTLTIPRTAAPGTFTAWVGWWKGKSRLPARAGGGAKIVDNRLAAFTIEVAP